MCSNFNRQVCVLLSTECCDTLSNTNTLILKKKSFQKNVKFSFIGVTVTIYFCFCEKLDKRVVSLRELSGGGCQLLAFQKESYNFLIGHLKVYHFSKAQVNQTLLYHKL